VDISEERAVAEDMVVVVEEGDELRKSFDQEGPE
jgi:hypothetical protein